MSNMRLDLIFFTLCLASPAVAAEFDRALLPDPITDADYMAVTPAEAELGQLLFFDPILSGNDNISCSTCHHPRLGTSDGLSLGMGEGGIGLAPNRVANPDNLPEDRIPRNAPVLYNLGAREYTVMFHDGRVEMTGVIYVCRSRTISLPAFPASWRRRPLFRCSRPMKWAGR